MYIRTTVGARQEPLQWSLGDALVSPRYLNRSYFNPTQTRPWLGFSESSQVQPRPSPAVSPLQVLKRAGLTTEQWADQKTPALIQAALQQSRALGQFIVNKLGKITISKDYHHYGSDPEFVHVYLKLHKIVVPEQEVDRNENALLERGVERLLPC